MTINKITGARVFLGSVPTFSSSAGFDNKAPFFGLGHFTPNGTSLFYNISNGLGAHSFSKLPDEVHEWIH